MTYNETRRRYRIYVIWGWLSFAIGIWLLIFIFVRSIYYSLNPGQGLFFALESSLKVLIDQLYGNWTIFRWTFDAVPDFITSNGPLAFLTPVGLIALFLIFSPTMFALPNARKLKTRMDEINELIHKQEMLASRGSMRNQQSIGNVSGKGDVNIKQEITNHFNRAPDKPLRAALISIIGTIASGVVGFFLTRLLGH